MSGASLNDEDDENETLSSITEAERQVGTKLATPEINKENYKVSGTKVQNLMASDSRISSQMLDDGATDLDETKKTAFRLQQEEKVKQ